MDRLLSCRRKLLASLLFGKLVRKFSAVGYRVYVAIAGVGYRHPVTSFGIYKYCTKRSLVGRRRTRNRKRRTGNRQEELDRTRRYQDRSLIVEVEAIAH